MTLAQSAALREALTLADAAIPVFPCAATKRPTCQYGFKAACTDPAAVRALWTESPGTLVGVPTGDVSGISVLDIDPKNAGAAWWVENRSRLPATRLHQTRSGGLHAIFHHRPGVRTTAGIIGPGVDTRGAGGYIIWWPAHGGRVRDLPLARWPDWLLDAITPPPKPVWQPATVPTTALPGMARDMVARSLTRVRNAAQGQRHYQLIAAGRTIGGLLGQAGLTADEAERQVLAAVAAAGAEDMRLAQKTAAWAIAEGQKLPLILGPEGLR